MPETDSSLGALALLYANGELDETDCATFEQRLASDQDAREALAQAVELVETLTGAGHLPTPDYRTRVRSRLLPRGPWSWLGRRRSYRGHPVAWLLAGATTAAILFLARPLAAPSVPPPPVPSEPSTAVTPEPPPPTETEAKLWGELTNVEHLASVMAEVKARRDRLPSKKPGNLDLRSSKKS
jgi:hypothetical protein